MSKKGPIERHESLERLLSLAAEKGVKGPAALAVALGVSDQTVTNWKSRGVPAHGAISAQEKLGASPSYITDGIEPRWTDTAAVPPRDESPLVGRKTGQKSSEDFAPYVSKVLKSVELFAQMLRGPQRVALTGVIATILKNPEGVKYLDQDQFDALLLSNAAPPEPAQETDESGERILNIQKQLQNVLADEHARSSKDGNDSEHGEGEASRPPRRDKQA